MKAMLSAACEKVGRIVALIVSQILGGAILGIVTVAAIGLFIATSQDVAPLAGDWHCSTKQVKTIELADVHLDVEARECVAGDRYAQTTTAISASRLGQQTPTKVFEYFISHRANAELAIEPVDARTVRIVMPDDEEAGREGTDARYMGLRQWGDITFLYKKP
jgi:hypothetical protein